MHKLLILFILAAANSCASPAVNAATINRTDTVLICKSKAAHAYHRYECGGLRHCTYQLVKITQEQAIAKGYRPCKICYKK